MRSRFVHVAVTNFVGGAASGSVSSVGFGTVAEGMSPATRVGCGVMKSRPGFLETTKPSGSQKTDDEDASEG